MKSKYVISRHWHEPEIKASIDHEQVSLEIGMEDYIQALVTEMQKHPFWVFRRKTLTKLLQEAHKTCAEKVKEASIHII